MKKNFLLIIITIVILIIGIATLALVGASVVKNQIDFVIAMLLMSTAWLVVTILPTVWILKFFLWAFRTTKKKK